MMRFLAFVLAIVALFGLSFALSAGPLPPGAITSCAVISAPGNYTLFNSVSGAPYPLPGMSESACILINSSNVAFDCQHNTISIGTGSYQVGVALLNVSNVAVSNCVVRNASNGLYPKGFFVYNSAFSNLSSNSVHFLYYGFNSDGNSHDNIYDGNSVENGTYGFWGPWYYSGANPGHSTYSGNEVFGSSVTAYGVLSDNNTYTGNSADNSGQGFRVMGSGNTLDDNEVTDVSGDCFYMTDTAHNVLSNNYAQYCGGDGFSVLQSNYTLLINNTALNASSDGFLVSDLEILASHSTLTGNNGSGNGQNGFHLRNTDNNVLDNNTALFNSQSGFLLEDLGLVPFSHNNLSFNTANNNSFSGFMLAYTDNNILKNNTAIGNDYGYLIEGSLSPSELKTAIPVPVGPAGGNNTLIGNYAQDSAYGFYVSGSVYNLLSRNTAVNNSNGYRLQNGGNNTLTDNLALNQFGGLPNVCYWIGSDFNKLTGNNATGCFRGYRIQGYGNTLDRNTAEDGPSSEGWAYGFYLSADGNTLNGNTASGNDGVGFYMDDYNGPSSDNVLSNNTASGNSYYGFDLVNSEFNVIDRNLAFENGYDGFYVTDYPAQQASYNNLTRNEAHHNGYNGFHLSNSDNERLDQNTAYNNSNDGFLVENGFAFSYNNLTNNVAHDNENNGFEFSDEDNSLLESNTAYSNLGNGFSIGGYSIGSRYNSIVGNTAYLNGANGFYLYYSDYNDFVNNTAYENGIGGPMPSEQPLLRRGGSGFYVSYGADYNNITGLHLYNNSFAGFEEQGGDTYNNYTNVQTHDNPFGVFLDYESGETFVNLTAHDNYIAGLYEYTCASPAITVLDSHLYNNGWEVMQNSQCSVPFTMNNTVFGTTPRVNLTIIDEVGSGGGGYSLNETPAPGPAPAGLTSFRDKYLKVYFTGDLGVNRTVLHWTPNEAVNFNESGIALYTWNGSGWLLTPNQTLDAASHSLTVLNLQNMFGDDTYGLFTTTNFTTTPGGGPSGGESTLSVGMQSNCSGNVVTVSSGGPVQGAEVLVNGDSVGTTDQNGQTSFQGCGSSVTLRAIKSGFQDGVTSAQEIACGQCAAPKCTTDADCASDQKCQVNQDPALNQCVLVSCSCGQTASDHQCTGAVYQCGTGLNCPSCPSGETCNADHRCVQSGCTSDLQCQDDEVCRTSSGAPGTNDNPGSCKPLCADGSNSCQCSQAENHTLVPLGYECGTDPGCSSCPSGQSCVDHKCIQNDITCPSSVAVGGNATCQVTQNNQACGPNDNCTTVITTPDGRNITLAPDENGNVDVPGSISGRVKVQLLKNGQVVKEVFIDVVPKSQPNVQQPPSSAGGGDLFSLIWLLLLLLVVVGVVVYWRSRGQKRK